ncbi:hypothetical protein niasHS_011856 [Heterodera schachtii]|uniref:Secreted protein n=1 Tax=Heterodera schachtii TaxID=97005 RepID=A0ABD2IR40_HETSC
MSNCASFCASACLDLRPPSVASLFALLSLRLLLLQSAPSIAFSSVAPVFDLSFHRFALPFRPRLCFFKLRFALHLCACSFWPSSIRLLILRFFECEIGSLPKGSAQRRPPECEIGLLPKGSEHCRPSECEIGSLPKGSAHCRPSECEIGSLPKGSAHCRPSECEIGSLPKGSAHCRPSECEIGSLPKGSAHCRPSECEIGSLPWRMIIHF